MRGGLLVDDGAGLGHLGAMYLVPLMSSATLRFGERLRVLKNPNQRPGCSSILGKNYHHRVTHLQIKRRWANSDQSLRPHHTLSVTCSLAGAKQAIVAMS